MDIAFRHPRRVYHETTVRTILTALSLAMVGQGALAQHSENHSGAMLQESTVVPSEIASNEIRIAWKYVFATASDTNNQPAVESENASKIRKTPPISLTPPKRTGATATPAPETLATPQKIKSAQSDEETASLTEAERAALRTEARLKVLNRPMQEVEFSETSTEAKAPANQAAEVLATSKSLLITMTPHSVRPLNRYPVAAMHQPLYFQEMNLERCGNACGCLQTAVSTVSFFTNVMILPYRIAQRPWNTIECHRLDCPSGNSLPCIEPTQASCRGVILQTAFAVGMTFLLL